VRGSNKRRRAAWLMEAAERVAALVEEIAGLRA